MTWIEGGRDERLIDTKHANRQSLLNGRLALLPLHSPSITHPALCQMDRQQDLGAASDGETPRGGSRALFVSAQSDDESSRRPRQQVNSDSDDTGVNKRRARLKVLRCRPHARSVSGLCAADPATEARWPLAVQRHQTAGWTEINTPRALHSQAPRSR